MYIFKHKVIYCIKNTEFAYLMNCVLLALLQISGFDSGISFQKLSWLWYWPLSPHSANLLFNWHSLNLSKISWWSQEAELIATKKTLPSLSIPVIRLEGGTGTFIQLTELRYSKCIRSTVHLKTFENPVILTGVSLDLSNTCPSLPSSVCGYVSNDALHLLIGAFRMKLIT